MQEERAVSWGYTPSNAVPFIGATRDVFNDQMTLSENVFEDMPVRLRKPTPSNEVMCLPKDDIGKTCPQLLPAEPAFAPPNWGTCSGFGKPGGIKDPGLMGDEYVSNFGVGTDNQLLFPAGGRAPKRPAPAGRWYFPGDPHAKGLKRKPVPKDVVLGPSRLRLGLRRGDAGAIRSIKMRGREFLIQHRPKGNAKGSALQMTIAANIPPGGNDQQRRANEAGGEWNVGDETTSRLLELHTSTGKASSKKCADRFVSTAFTKSQASWWRRPGAAVKKARVLNNGTMSPYIMTKRVVAGADGFTYVGGVRVPAEESPRNVRISTRFSLKRSFNRVLAFHARTQRWVALPRSRSLRAGRYRALAVTNKDGSMAIGFTLRDMPKPPKGARLQPSAYYAVNVTNRKAGTVVSAVHQVGVRGGRTALPARTWSYHLAFKVGTLKNVTRQLANLAINLTPFSQRLENGKGKKASACAAAGGKKTWKARAAVKRCLNIDDVDELRRPASMRGGPVRGAVGARAEDGGDYNDDGGIMSPRVRVKTCTVAAKARCRKNKCGPGDRRAVCKNCVKCSKFATKKPAKAGRVKDIVKVCRVVNSPACKRRRCTKNSKTKACRPCVKCVWQKKKKGAQYDEVIKKKRVCRVLPAKKCKGCKVGDKRPRCKGCVKCTTVAITSRPPAPAGTVPLNKRCVLRKTAKCRKCKLGSKAAACRGCTVCKAVKPETRCTLRKTPKCSKCKLGAKAGVCRGCTVCKVVKPNVPKVTAKAKVAKKVAKVAK